jgi:hypothetical protein
MTKKTIQNFLSKCSLFVEKNKLVYPIPKDRSPPPPVTCKIKGSEITDKPRDQRELMIRRFYILHVKNVQRSILRKVREFIKVLLKNYVHFKRIEFSLVNYGLYVTQHEMKWEDRRLLGLYHRRRLKYMRKHIYVTENLFYFKLEFSITYGKLYKLHALLFSKLFASTWYVPFHKVSVLDNLQFV